MKKTKCENVQVILSRKMKANKGKKWKVTKYRIKLQSTVWKTPIFLTRTIAVDQNFETVHWLELADDVDL